MNPSISDKLEQLTGRLDELDRMLASGQATQDMDEYRRLSREHAELGPVVALYQVWRQTQKDLLSGIEMLADPEMRELAEAEVATLTQELIRIDSSNWGDAPETVGEAEVADYCAQRLREVGYDPEQPPGR